MKGAGKRKACGERGEGSEDKEEKGGGKGGKRAEGGGRTERQRRARRRGTQKQAGRGEVREMRRAEGGKRRRMGEGRATPYTSPHLPIARPWRPLCYPFIQKVNSCQWISTWISLRIFVTYSGC